MSATAAMISKLRRMVDEPTDTTYDDSSLSDYIEDYPLIDQLGNDPFEVDYTTTPPTISEIDHWIPTYDLHAAAVDIWVEKAAAVAEKYDFSADGGNYKQSQKYENYMKNARWHASRRAAKSATIEISPRPDKKEPSNAD